MKLFAIDLDGFSLTDCRLHLLRRLDPGRAKPRPAEEVIRRWLNMTVRDRLTKLAQKLAADQDIEDFTTPKVVEVML